MIRQTVNPFDMEHPMKPMIAAAASAVLFACVAPAWADQDKTSPVLAWNRIAQEAIERGKPNC